MKQSKRWTEWTWEEENRRREEGSWDRSARMGPGRGEPHQPGKRAATIPSPLLPHHALFLPISPVLIQTVATVLTLTLTLRRLPCMYDCLYRWGENGYIRLKRGVNCDGLTGDTGTAVV